MEAHTPSFLRPPVPQALLGGAAVMAFAAMAAGLPAGDTLVLVMFSGGAAAATGLGGALVLAGLRRSAFSTQVVVLVLTTVIAVAVGALAAGNRMFLSAHDLDALGVVLASAGAVGVAGATLLAARVTGASRTLGVTARGLGEGAQCDEQPRVAVRELAGLQAELRDAVDRLEESRSRERALEAARRELVAWVSHDLRTPLAGIRAISEALEDGVVTDDAAVARYHRTLRREVERLSLLVDDLFELSRIQTGALRLTLERVDLGEVVSDAVAAALPVAEAKGVHLEGRQVGYAPPLPLDPPGFARVLRNLIENAIRETPADGTVSVETGVDAGTAWVAVADTCGGIPAADLPRVFETAFRGSAARTPEHDAGAGLGLAIARGLVEAHHGEITVANVGDGCRFEVRLPLVA